MTAAGLRLIIRWEGYRRAAYPDPGLGWDVPTIGYGTTIYANGERVKPGDLLSEPKARQELVHHVDALISPRLKAIPGWDKMSEPMRGALESFAYNLGANFYGSSKFESITGALKSRAWDAVPKYLALYVRSGGVVLAGLVSRRDDEAEAWRYGLKLLRRVPASSAGIPDSLALNVPWFSQLDTLVPGQADRTCFSSSCAMVLEYLKPGTLRGPNGDDEYLQRVGASNTTRVSAQLQALRSYGVRAEHRTDLDWEDVFDELAAKRPVVAGILHRGPAENPYGGHRIVFTGWEQNQKVLRVHDPYGELDLPSGTYLHPDGRDQLYSRAGLEPRFHPGGTGGWGLLVRGLA